MVQSAQDEINKAKEAKLWLDFSADDVAYFIVCGPSDCHHHNRPFDKPAKCLTEEHFFETKVNGEIYEREIVVIVFAISRISLLCCLQTICS